MSFNIAPDADQVLVLQPGDYGTNGEAGCLKVVGRTISTEKMRAPVSFVDFQCYVDLPEGRVLIGTSPFGEHNTQTGSKTGSKVHQFLRNMGMEPTFASEPDADQVFGYLGPNDPAGTKVILTVAYNARTKRNEIANIQRRA